jgi:prolyl-tRNA editing enzyme YbaK/EbsC (Cys-tRNA(Pro) deacylase)
MGMQSESKKSSSSKGRFQQTLDQYKLNLHVVELPQSTRTALEAAEAIGCGLGQIVKSLIFRGVGSGDPVLVLASGSNQVDEKKIQALIGEAIQRADPGFVRQETGFAIGGVPPIGHRRPIKTVIDQDLLDWDEIWAAAGTPNAVFRLNSEDLLRMTSVEASDIARLAS